MWDGQVVQTKAKCEEVLRAVSRRSDVSVEVLRGKNRRREFAMPRQVAAYLSRELTGLSFPQIGRLLGDQHHTTVLFSWRKIGRLAASGYPGLERMIADLKAEIMAEAEIRREREQRLRMSVPVQEPDFRRPRTNPRPRWTMEQITELKRLRARHASRKEMADRLQRSVHAIEHKLYEYGLTRHQRQAPTGLAAWARLGGEMEAVS